METVLAVIATAIVTALVTAILVNPTIRNIIRDIDDNIVAWWRWNISSRPAATYPARHRLVPA